MFYHYYFDYSNIFYRNRKSAFRLSNRYICECAIYFQESKPMEFMADVNLVETFNLNSKDLERCP